MKKLVYLLVLSLCLSSATGVSSAWMSALAEKDSGSVSDPSPSNPGSSRTLPKSSGSEAKKSKSGNSKNKLKKTEVEKKKEYILDLDKNSQVHLSTILKFAKIEIKLKDIKSIKYEDKKYKKYISWEPDEEKEYDYVFTVLKNFKEIRLRIVTKKDEKLLVLQNGAKAVKDKVEKRDDDTPGQQTEEKAAPLPEPEQPADEIQADNGKADEDSADEATLTLDTPEAVESEAASDEAEQSADTETDNAVDEQTVVEIEPDGSETQDTPEAPAREEASQAVEASSAESADAEASIEADQDETVVTVEGETDAASAAAEAPAETGEGQAASTDNQPESTDGKSETGEAQATAPENQEKQTEEKTEQVSGAPDAEGMDSPRQGAGTQIPMEAEAWFKRGTDLQWGTLQEIVALLTGGETVYIQTGNLLMIRQAPLQMLSTVVMTPDTDVFKGGNYAVCISVDNPAIVAEPVLIQPIQMPTLGEKADLYVWVRQDESTAPGDQGEGEKPALVVTATGLAEQGWSRTQPQFTLSGIPEGKDWSYATIIYDERIVPITYNSYTPDQEGVYTVRFAMLDELGDIVSASKRYSLQLDWTPPEVSIEADEETDYTLNISASDNASGVDKISIDGGKTWHSMEDGSYTITEKEEKTFEAGAIQVTDVAGNLFKTSEEYTTEEAEGGEGEEGEEGEDAGDEGGGGGGGGGDSSNTPKLPHSSGDGDEGTEYDALSLDIPDEPMEQLTVGGERLDLTLLLASAQEAGAPVGKNRPFTAWLRHWDDASEGDALNTLVLEADLDDNMGDVFSYEWHFNGEVYRMLANSGIKYMALKVSDAVVAFPTEGFVGGTRYTELKMQGVSTRKFDYTFTMRLNLDPSHVSAMNESDFSQDCDLSIHVEVEGKNYELSNSPQSMMYFYNVFVGPEDMMDQPFGEYEPAA